MSTRISRQCSKSLGVHGQRNLVSISRVVTRKNYGIWGHLAGMLILPSDLESTMSCPLWRRPEKSGNPGVYRLLSVQIRQVHNKGARHRPSMRP